MTRRPTLGILAAASLAAAIGGPALATSEPDTDTPIAVDLIEGIDWTLLRQQVDGALTSLPDGVHITLLMEDGAAGGNGGCNDYFASYRRDGDALAFDGIGSTEMYCPDSSDLESAYFADLAAVATGFSTGGTLIMTDVDGETILEYGVADTSPIPTDSIEGLGWQLDALVLPGEPGPASAPEGADVSIVLEDGVATGNGGCNGFSASYQLDGTALTFGQIASTKMACPEPIMALEDALFTQLAAVATWSSDGASVTLFDVDGTELLRLSREG